MENLEIHSKSYLVRWVSVSGNRTISWSIQPHKKSINLGIFKHPGGNAQSINPLPASIFEPPPTPQVEPINASSRRVSSSRNEASTAAEKLQGIGLILIQWIGRCDADKVSTGSYDVPAGQGSMYALVFDNTFSKQVSKTATLVLMTYPTNSPPETSFHLHHLQAGSAATISTSSLSSKQSPRISSFAADSTDSLHELAMANVTPTGNPWHSPNLDTQQESKSPSFYTGLLQKRRRKRHQGYARRFFSLDFTTGTLSYYHDQHSSALRGAIPLALAVVGANEKTREISVDSGAEVWHLRASTQKDFDAWRRALERASSSAMNVSTAALMVTAKSTALPRDGPNAIEDQEWARIEALVGRVAGIRDAVRRLTTDTGCSPSSDMSKITAKFDSMDTSPTEMPGNDYFQDREKRRFWKRKTSNGTTSPRLFHRSSSGRRSHLASSPMTTENPPHRQPHEVGMHAHCRALLNDLDTVVDDFSQLITGSKRRRMTRVLSHMSQRSVDSMSTAEFFDAEDGNNRNSQMVKINDSEEEERGESPEDNYDSDSASDAEMGGTFSQESPAEGEHYTSLFPPRPKSLAPLPLDLVKRRTNIPPAMVQPPSLIGFLRKNVGKDLSTISMPVSANEPSSLLQRLSEQLEYSSLLDKAAQVDMDSTDRLLYITAFAISCLSNSRVKERAIRKPFNPMLGETFELVREDLGFRFIAEKVCHRPVRMACQAESQNWTYSHSPSPTQKFWGKSAELLTDGKVRVILHTTRDCFTWTTATCFLRNILAGEKYVEPVGSMIVVNETSGQKAIATFKSKGMFSGRSEDVLVQTFSRTGEELSQGLEGKWTSHLSLTQPNPTTTPTTTIWTIGALIDSPANHYGFTAFATTLNEITSIEKSHLPPTDSRLRPDQRSLERGDLDKAEVLKEKLEEAQRARRKNWETQGRTWEPKWFERVDGDGGGGGGVGDEEVWRLKTGKNGYWEERERGEWTGVLEDLFTV
ncbi:MAG: hypothetical protein M1816_006925 [Peltula sp. TS41687]|nr:MAG: hypothetical protein M1816_006925 [Peltula sp. TS41687]